MTSVPVVLVMTAFLWHLAPLQADYQEQLMTETQSSLSHAPQARRKFKHASHISRLATLYIVHSDRKPFGIVLTKIATDTGNFTVH